MVDIFYLGHSAFLIKTESISFVIDPYKKDSVPGLDMPIIEADAVFCSHEHFDHNGREMVKLTNRKVDIDYQTIVVPHDKENGAKRGLNKIHIFNLDNYRIAHLGDIGCIPSPDVLKQLSDIDIVLAPINGFFTISAQELHDICEIIKPRIVVPMHYFRKENNSGYPDGGQIDIFKRLYPHYLKVNDNHINLNDDLFKNSVVIFE